ncbi:hypothetical protein DSM107133_00841 [Pseudosulfitobacter sp. DSM 107133]|nr:hypothetical protein DSM107133_00841 [Pseudosulfitobacter sp. DSM 107133]
MIQDLKELVERLFSVFKCNVTTADVNVITKCIGIIVQMAYSAR